MLSESALSSVDLSVIEAHSAKAQLRLLTCGSVDDGKSTLIGRLLYDAQLLTTDQIAALTSGSKQASKPDGHLDFALLLDGLSAEREQGITIDVAYRYFSTQKRSFIVADCPGHEQYTRNMVTGASQCELAILLVDASKGLQPQTRRHALIAAKLGIKKIVLAVNKMDLVDWSQDRFNEIVTDFQHFTKNMKWLSAVYIPMSGLSGENVALRASEITWYQGPTLLDHLETVELAESESETGPLRVIVQGSVLTPKDTQGHNTRAITGYVAAGAAFTGALVRIMPSGRVTAIADILMPQDSQNGVIAGKAITFTLEEETDCGRGDLVCAQNDAAQMSDAFKVDLVWMTSEPLSAGQRFWLKIGATLEPVCVVEILNRLDIQTGDQGPAQLLDLNALGQVVLALNRPIAFEAFEQNAALGSLILIDRQTNATVAAGMIIKGVNLASENLHWQHIEVNAAAHATQKAQTPLVVWFTGLSGAGKSTIANLVEKQLFALGNHTYLLDGDNLRYGLNRDLGFSAADRTENIRRAGEVAHLMFDAGLIVLAAFISPFANDRTTIRNLMPEGRFLEVHVDVSLEIAQQRDPKGLYAKARAGLLSGLTGVDSPYELAEHPEIYIDSQKHSAIAAADIVVAQVRALQRK